MTKRRGKGFNIIKMVLNILENFQMEWNKVKGYFSGAMEKFMMDNGRMVEKMEVECGKVLQETHTLENGIMEELKDLGFWFKKQETDMKESSKTQWRVGLGLKDMWMEVHTLVNS